MSHSYISNRLHVVFSTKDRRDLILDSTRLWAYMEGIGKNHNIPVFVAGGTANHIHLLLTVPATIPVAKAIQTLKANSSKWMRATIPDFAWQEGYGAFSVSASGVDAVAQYIRNQPKHHAEHSFEDEFRSLLMRHGLSFDERYVLG
ncbi:MAG: IS200/IS605 family transposase [Terriglobales bacterium]